MKHRHEEALPLTPYEQLVAAKKDMQARRRDECALVRLEQRYGASAAEQLHRKIHDATDATAKDFVDTLYKTIELEQPAAICRALGI